MVVLLAAQIEAVDKKGFSILEVLVGLFIIALIFYLVPLFFPTILANAHAKAAVRELMNNLKYVRSQAIISQQDTSLTLDVENKRYQVNDREKNLVLSEHASLSLITAKSEQLSDKIGRIRFFPDGSSTGGRITLKHGTHEYVINVNWLTGRVKILQGVRKE